MAEYGTEILAEQEIQFAESGMAGLYIGIFSSVVPFAIGKTYILVWNGTEYECTAAAASFNGVDGVGIGNFALAGLGENTREPFLLGTATDGSMTVCYSIASGLNTISVYLVEEDAPTVTDTLVLLDNQGIEQHLTGVKSLKVLTTGGAEQTFIAGEAVEASIDLDFSSGENMVVVPDTGKFFEKVTIIKPASLVESNIAKDVDVAGVIGTHEGGDNETARVEYTYDDSGNLVGASFVKLKAVPAYALYAQTKVTTVDFSRSPNLTSIGSYAFYNCQALTSIVIPDAVTSIGSYAFNDCTALTSITLPKTLKTIGSAAFSYCSVKTVYFKGNLEDWLSITFDDSPLTSSTSLYIEGVKLSGNIVIPSTITKIGDEVFCYLKAITSVEIHDSVTSIGEDAFRSTGLTSVEIPDAVTSIGSGAFYGDDSLISVVVGNGVTSLGSSVFGYCDKLSSVTLKEGLTIIGGYMFQACSALESITIPASVTKIGTYAFSGCSNLSSVTDGGSTGWYISTSSSATSGTSVSLTAYNLMTKYRNYYWFRKTT